MRFGPAPPFCTSTAPTISILPWWLRPPPPVTESWRPQVAHSHVHGLVCSSQALLVPQPGQTKPCGQRAAKRYLAHPSSSEKRCWNSINERGKSLTVASQSGLCSLFVLTYA